MTKLAEVEKLVSGFGLYRYDPSTNRPVYIGEEAQETIKAALRLAAQAQEDAKRWQKLLTMSRSLVIDILKRPDLAVRYLPDKPYTLKEEVDAAISAEKGKP